eukprot:gb/GEZN01012235.1/.p1 GENE.gb/GEZN01012235.1/~~gb/GEZN01012235.1/.p1  ORF type:complete len:281 (+),score=24.31 gb/GEZN01012235.1/:42-884(+)
MGGSWLILSALVASVCSFSQGAPICSTSDLSVITGMRSAARCPDSPNAARSCMNTWSVMASSESFAPGQAVEVKLMSSDTTAIIAGFVLTASMVGSGDGVGVLQQGDGGHRITRTIPSGGPCIDQVNFLTHNGTLDKLTFSAKWIAPMDLEEAYSVKFSAIVLDELSGGQAFHVATPIMAALMMPPIETTVKPPLVTSSTAYPTTVKPPTTAYPTTVKPPTVKPPTVKPPTEDGEVDEDDAKDDSDEETYGKEGRSSRKSKSSRKSSKSSKSSKKDKGRR